MDSLIINMIDEILDNKVKIKIAKLFSERKEEFQVSDVARILNISKSRASECLRELENDGFLKSKTIGRSRVYQLKRSFITDTITSYLQDKSVMKRIETRIKKEIKKLNPVSFVLFGSSLYSLKPGKDIDFLLIYENKPPENIYEISSKLTEEFGLDVSILTMSAEEFKRKAKKGEEFILNIVANHKVLIGKKLEDIIW